MHTNIGFFSGRHALFPLVSLGAMPPLAIAGSTTPITLD